MPVSGLDAKPIATVIRLSAHFLSTTKGVACLLRPQVMVDGGTHRSDSGSNAPEDLRRLREHTGGKSFFVGFFMLVVWEMYCKDFFLGRISKKDRVAEAVAGIEPW